MRRFVSVALASLLLGSTPALADAIGEALVAWSIGDFTTAFRLLRPLAEQGNAEAQYQLGFMYSKGQGVSENLGLAVSWYLKAAEQGHAEAQYTLGQMYHFGEGVGQDYVRAFLWLSLAAVSMNAQAELENLVGQMTPGQIAEAQRLVAEGKSKLIQ